MGQRVGIHKLSAREVTAAGAGYHGDGGGLWLQVSPAGTRSWVFRYARLGKAREMGLGALHTVPLALARDKAKSARQQLLDGVDPIEARKALKLTAQAAVARMLTFDQAAEQYIEAHRAGWRNAKHGDQWTATMKTYASPIIGKLPVSAIDTPLVVKIIEPIWVGKTETAKRVRGRIEAILDWATVRGYRSGENPARWRGHLALVLPAPEKVSKAENHPALPYARIGEFVPKLRAEQGTAARAVELIILTACRTSEAFNAQRDEFDLDAAVWTIPADRMKAGRSHRVPLSRQAVTLLRKLALEQGADYIFPGAKEGRPLSNMAGLKLLERMGYSEITVHGFRSSFRDWAAEQTNYPREVAEAALAHVLKDKTEAAYQRGDLLEKRARLMQAWADYCGRVGTTGSVTALRTKVA